MSKTILAADIGGTSSRYALFSFDDNSKLNLLKTHWLKTAEFKTFSSQLRRLLEERFINSFSEIDSAVIAGAGPVEHGKKIALTQVSWAVDLTSLEQDLSLRTSLAINDFVAQAYGCVTEIAESADVILQGQRGEGAIAVVGAGTGLGMAALVRDTNGFTLAVPSEGGHVNYAGETAEEIELARFIAAELKVRYASLEDTLSGRGLKLTHKFLTGEEIPPEEIGKKLDKHPETVRFFARNYGRVCRNLTLQYLSTGGVFIAGGIATKNKILVTHPAFEESFRNPRQHQKLLASAGVYLLDNEESGLWGAGFLGAQI